MMQGSNLRDIQNLDTTVVGLQGNPISADVPGVGQTLVWDGTEWSPTNLAVGISEADGDVRYVERAGDSMFGTLIFPGPTTGVDINNGSIHLNASDLLMSGNTGLERIGLSRTGATQIEGIPITWADSGAQLARMAAGRGPNQGYLGVQVFNVLNNSWSTAWSTRQVATQPGQAWLQLYADPVQPSDAATKQYVDGVVTQGSTTLIGVFEADTDTCHYASTLPYLNPGPLVTPDTAGAGAYLICDEAGTMPPGSEAAGLTFVVGDWVISDGTDWLKLSVGTPNLSASAVAVFPAVAGANNVQDALTAMLPMSGGTMTGPLVLAANAAAPLQPIPLQQLTSTLAGYLPLTGGTLTGNVVINRSDAQFSINSIGNGSRATLFWGNGTINHFQLYRNNGATSLSLDRFDDAGNPTAVLAVNRNTGAIALAGGSTLTLTGDATFPLQPVTLQQATARYLPFAGGVMTGALTLNANATQPLQAVPLQQLNSAIAALPPGGVSSFNNRTGAITLTTADVTGAGGAPIANPTFTGVATAPQFNATLDNFGYQTFGQGWFYKKSGTGLVIRAPTGNQQLQIEDNNGQNTRAVLDVNNGVRKAGDTMTGLLVLSGVPTAVNGAATKGYVDTADALRVLKTGDTMSGVLNMGGQFIINVADPGNSAADAANKRYVDQRVLRTGDTMTGPLTLPGNVTGALQAVPLQQVQTIAAGVGTWQSYTANSLSFYTGVGQIGIRSRTLNAGAFSQFEAQVTCTGSDWPINQSRTLQGNTGYLPPGQRPDVTFAQAATVSIGASIFSVRVEVGTSGAAVIRNTSGGVIPFSGAVPILQFVVAIPVAAP